MAEREGFEPSIRVNVYTLSRRAPSTTRTSLRGAQVIRFSYRVQQRFRRTWIGLKHPGSVSQYRSAGRLSWSREGLLSASCASALRAALQRPGLFKFSGGKLGELSIRVNGYTLSRCAPSTTIQGILPFTLSGKLAQCKIIKDDLVGHLTIILL